MQTPPKSDTISDTIVAYITLLHPNAKVPLQATQLSTGYDVYSPDEHILHAQSIAKIPLGFPIKPPNLHYTQLQSRSGLALKVIIEYGGVIDPDYRGEMCTILHNTSTHTHIISPGDRIVQLIFLTYTYANNLITPHEPTKVLVVLGTSP